MKTTKKLCSTCEKIEATKPCCICGAPITRCEENNAEPVWINGWCCSDCDTQAVVPARGFMLRLIEKRRAAVN
jgi:hypothetical protein